MPESLVLQSDQDGDGGTEASSLIIPEIQHQQQVNNMQSPDCMKSVYYQSQHNEITGNNFLIVIITWTSSSVVKCKSLKSKFMVKNVKHVENM